MVGAASFFDVPLLFQVFIIRFLIGNCFQHFRLIFLARHFFYISFMVFIVIFIFISLIPHINSWWGIFIQLGVVRRNYWTVGKLGRGFKLYESFFIFLFYMLIFIN